MGGCSLLWNTAANPHRRGWLHRRRVRGRIIERGVAVLLRTNRPVSKRNMQQSTFELGPREWREWSLFRGFNERTWEVSFFILLRCACLRINHHLTQSFLWNFSNNLIFDCSIAAAKQQLSAATGKQLINQSIGACASVDCGECSTLCLPNEFLLTNNLHDS